MANNDNQSNIDFNEGNVFQSILELVLHMAIPKMLATLEVI